MLGLFGCSPLTVNHSAKMNRAGRLHLYNKIHYGSQSQLFSVYCLPLQAAHSTCGDSEYNLRSRTVVCGSCGQTSDKNSTCVSASSGVSSASRSFSCGGGLPEAFVSPSHFIVSNDKRRQVCIFYLNELHQYFFYVCICHFIFKYFVLDDVIWCV